MAHPSKPNERNLRCEHLEDRRLLAVVTVDTVEDVVDFNDGVTSLREAIFATNTIAGADEIDFDFGIDGPATIVLTEGELQITDSLTIIGPGRDLLTIDASGNDPTPNENNGDGSRVFTIDDGINDIFQEVNFQGFSIAGGDANGSGGGIRSLENLLLDSVTLTDNSMMGTRQYGGGIYQGRGTLTVQNSLITENYTPNYSGAGIAIQNGALIVSESRISGNVADFNGGGINASQSDVVISSSVIESNQASGSGGGISLSQGTFLLEESTIRDNTARNSGGGIDLSTESGTIVDSVIHGNQSETTGGGISANTREGQISLHQTTISNNNAADGGGISAYALFESGKIQIDHSTIVENLAYDEYGGGLFAIRGLVEIDHSVIADNSAAVSGTDIQLFTPSSSFALLPTIEVSHSLIGSNLGTELTEASVGLPDANGNLIGGPINGVIDPLLGPLADNGGPTPTHALLPGSPAINAGDLNAVAGVDDVPEFDQRGDVFDRIVSRIDIGAYEVQELGDMNLLVDTLVDESDGDYSRGDLSLREAIELANANPVPDTINFDPILTAVAGPLPATILLTEGELQITDSLTINGPGRDLLTIDASGNDPTPESTHSDEDDTNDGDGSRVFLIDDGDAGSQATVVLMGLNLTGGDAQGEGGAVFSSESLRVIEIRITDNHAGAGGGIHAEFTDLEIVDSLISNNTAQFSGGVRAIVTETIITGSTISDNKAQRFGGGISVFSGSLNAADLVVSGNTAGIDGGGIYAFGDVTIEGGVVSENKAGGVGGGVFNRSNAITLIDTEFTNNTAEAGGGIYSNGSLSIAGSRITDNLARSTGGGIHSNLARGGGVLKISGSTIAGNRAETDGGGIYGFGFAIGSSVISGNTAGGRGGGIFGGTTIANSTITHNVAGTNEVLGGYGGGLFALSAARIQTTTIENTIVAGNEDVQGIAPDVSGGPISSHSVVGDNTGSGLAESPAGLPDANGNLIGGPINGVIDPLLGPLADNGGPTPTHALLPGSPAINAGDLNAVAGVDDVPEFDQRGDVFDRIVSRIDIGAYEVQELGDMNLLVDTLVDESDGDYSRGDLSLREAIELANANPVPDKIEFDPALLGTSRRPTILLTEGELQIIDSLTINGPGRALLIIDASGNDPTPEQDNGDGSRVFLIEADTTLDGLTLTGGDRRNGSAIFSRTNLTIEESAIFGNGGIGIRSTGSLVFDRSVVTANTGTGIDSDGELTVSGSTFVNNWAGIYSEGTTSIAGSTIIDSIADGIYAEGNTNISDSFISGNGGGVESTGTTFITNSNISGNFSDSYGGGVYVIGDASISNSIISNNTSLAEGGGIFSRGSISIDNSVVSGNSGGREGGGVHISFGNAIISDSEISGNYTNKRGGGIFTQAQTTITNSDISGNTVNLLGGGIASFGELHVLESTVSGNSAAGGAGIYAQGTPTINRSTISGNSANLAGGGILLFGNSLNNALISNTTVSGNSSDYDGGGIHSNVRTTIENSTITQNSAGTDEEYGGSGGGIFIDGERLTLDHSIVAGNTADVGDDVSGIVNSTFSLIGTGAEFLGPLADNGGPTLTHALLTGSPAINAGDPTLQQGDPSLPEFDQRGPAFARVAGFRIDIGAYESQSATGALDGDFDLDGDTDGTDFLAWQRGFGIETEAAIADGDATRNGAVDANDFRVWALSYDGVETATEGEPVAAIDLALSSDLIPSAEMALSADLLLSAEMFRDTEVPSNVRGAVARRNAWAEPAYVAETAAALASEWQADDASDRVDGAATAEPRETRLLDVALGEIFGDFAG